MPEKENLQKELIIDDGCTLQCNAFRVGLSEKGIKPKGQKMGCTGSGLFLAQIFPRTVSGTSLGVCWQLLPSTKKNTVLICCPKILNKPCYNHCIGGNFMNTYLKTEKEHDQGPLTAFEAPSHTKTPKRYNVLKSTAFRERLIGIQGILP